jgi:hypothetical protein
MADSWDESYVTDIEICPDGRMHIFGASQEIIALLHCIGWQDDRERRRNERHRRTDAESCQQQLVVEERAS